MISQSVVLRKFIDFTRVAAPVLCLHDNSSYEDAMDMVEHLMETVGDDHTKPENLLITLLSQAIKDYESADQQIAIFEHDAMQGQMDVAALRFIINQNNLTLSDLPEIGHKSLVSKILSGERNLTKSHIDKLSKRFHIDPGLFF
jgi:HTH-type transcriptional regulator/antitoxin HigA